MMNAAAAVLLLVCALPALVIASALWRGYVLSVLWGWFLVPLFSFPALSVPAAIGVSLVVGFLTMHRDANEAKEKREPGDAFLRALTFIAVYPALCLLTGWVVKQYL